MTVDSSRTASTRGAVSWRGWRVIPLFVMLLLCGSVSGQQAESTPDAAGDPSEVVTASPDTAETDPSEPSPDATDEPAVEQSADPSDQSDQSDQSDAGKPNVMSSAEPALPALPVDPRIGRLIRPIGVYQDELVELVPADFQVISLDQLERTLQASVDQESASKRIRLVSSFYDIQISDHNLISDLSKLVIEHDARGRVRCSLGKPSFAITDLTNGSLADVSIPGSVQPQLQVDHRGELQVVVPRLEAAANSDKPRSERQGNPPVGSAGERDDSGSPTNGDAAVVRNELRFAWTLQGQSIGNVDKFELRLPRTPQSRLVFSTPTNVRLSSRQGVLVERPGPPPDADLQSRAGAVRWYVLEASGLNRIELFAEQVTEPEAESPILIRRESKQYEIDYSGITWTHRMTIELPRTRRSLNLRAPAGTVTSVRVNSVLASPNVLRRTDGQTLIDFDVPSSLTETQRKERGDEPQPTNGNEMVTLTVSGNATWDLSDGRCDLPGVAFVDAEVVRTEPTSQAIVALLDSLEIARWELPDHWQQTEQTPARDGESLLFAEGPPTSLDGEQTVWSSVRIAAPDEVRFDEVWSRFVVQESPTRTVRATTRLRCRRLGEQQVPIRLEINPQWTIDSIVLNGSGRQLTAANNQRFLVIWPSPELPLGETMEIQVRGHRNLSPTQRRIEIPETWMVRVPDRVVSYLTSIQPPKSRRWDGDSIMLGGQVDAETLRDDALAFFKPSPETLLIRQSVARTPRVALERIDVSFDVSLIHEIENRAEEVVETIVVRTETPQPITELVVLTGQATRLEDLSQQHAKGRQNSQPSDRRVPGDSAPSSDLGPFRWSLRRIDQSVTVSIPRSDIRFSSNDPLGAYTISLDDRDLSEFELVGQRSFRSGNAFRLTLPSVRGATSQTAEAFLDPDWQVSDAPPSVQLVPETASPTKLPRLGRDRQHLRYDPLLRPEVVLRRAEPSEASCLVWKHTLAATAGSRNEDRIRLVASVSARRPFEVHFDPGLEVLSVARNGEPYSAERVGRGILEFAPERLRDQIEVTLRRRHDATGWIRRCVVPRVAVAGHVLADEEIVSPGDNTLLLSRGLLGGILNWLKLPAETSATEQTSATAQTSATEQTSDQTSGRKPGQADELIADRRRPNGTSVWLIPSDVAVGIGCWLSVLLFCLFWSVIRWWHHGAAFAVVALVVVLGASLIWWPWQVPILGWIALPIILAGMLEATRRWKTAPRIQADVTEQPSRRTDDSDPESRSGASGEASGFSGSTLLWGVVCVGLQWNAISISHAQTGQANEDRETTKRTESQTQLGASIDVLVPLDEDHRPAGDKVYLSKSDYQQIVSAADPERSVDAWFSGADYRIVLSQSRDQADVVTAVVEADYQIRLSAEASRIRLPLRAETIRRIEWVTESQARIARFQEAGPSHVIVTLPPGDRFRLRVTLVPTTVATEQSSDERAGSESESEDASEDDADDTEPLDEDPAQAEADTSEDPVSTEFRLTVPPIHTAKLVIETPREIVVDSFGPSIGRKTLRPDLGRYEAEIGPVTEISFVATQGRQGAASRSRSIRRVYRIVAGVLQTVVECEITPTEPVGEGDLLNLYVLGPAPTAVTSDTWRLIEEGSTMSGALEADESSGAIETYNLRFEKQSGDREPLRLMWRLVSRLNDPTSTEDSEVMPLPEVLSGLSNRPPSTLFGIEADSSIRLSQLAADSQPSTSEAFSQQWQGYSGEIERAFVATDSFPTFVLLRHKLPEATTDVEHALHVSRDGMQLTVRATVLDLASTIRRLLVSMPPRLELIECRINDEPTTDFRWLPGDRGDPENARKTLSLGDHRRDGKMTVELVGQLNWPRAGNLPLPYFDLNTVGPVEEQYRITRDREVRLEWAERPQGNDSDHTQVQWKPVELSEEDLAMGRVPFRQATLSTDVAENEGQQQKQDQQQEQEQDREQEQDQEPSVTGMRGSSWDSHHLQLRRLRPQVSFPCRQTTAMRYANGRWSIDTLLEIPGANCPDYIDVELPNRWATKLAVNGSETWVTKTSADGSAAVVRIAAGFEDTSTDGGGVNAGDRDRQLLITGTLDNREQLRVGVPSVTVLGAGKRERFIAVPDRLTTESIRWRRRGISPRLPDKSPVEDNRDTKHDDWFEPFAGRIENPESYSVYGVDSPNWAMELQPLSEAMVDPVALSCDARVYLNGDEALVYQWFDLLPETLSTVELSLPGRAELLGVWSAGREVSVHPHGDDQEGTRANTSVERDEDRLSDGNRKVEVPLSYSRLPQSLEVLVRIPAGRKAVEDYLVKLDDVPTERYWLAFYRSERAVHGRRMVPNLRTRLTESGALNSRVSPDDRAFSLAQSVVTSLDRSSDMLAERSNEETKRWLFPWLARYRAIAEQSGRRFDPRDQRSIDEEGGEPEADVDSTAGGDFSDAANEDAANWATLDRQLLQLSGRFFDAETPLPKLLFSHDRLSGFDLQSVVRLEDVNRLPPIETVYQPSESLRSTMINALTLAMIAAVAILLWPFRGRWKSAVHSPAVWLFLLATTGMLFTPWWLVGPLLLAVVILPLIPRMLPRSLRWR